MASFGEVSLPTEALDLKLPTEVLESNSRDLCPSFMDMVRVNQGKAGRIPGVKCEADTAQDADRRSLGFSVTADVVGGWADTPRSCMLCSTLSNQKWLASLPTPSYMQVVNSSTVNISQPQPCNQSLPSLTPQTGCPRGICRPSPIFFMLHSRREEGNEDRWLKRQVSHPRKLFPFGFTQPQP